MKAALLLVAAAVVGATGCSNNDISLSIVQMQAVTRTNMCVAMPGGGTALGLGRGLLDVSLVSTSGYIAVPVVQNNLMSNLNGVEFNAIQMSGANVKLTNIDGTALTLPNGQSSFFYASAAGRVAPGGSVPMFIELLPASAAKSLAGMIPSGGLFTVMAAVSPVGMKGDSQIVGGPINFPIDLCNGCLMDIRGGCPLAKGTITETPCFPQQDEAHICCTDATSGALLCDSQAPVATM